jgi:poly(A) polymerase
VGVSGPAATMAVGALREREGFDALTSALGGDTGETRFVGGVVRDTLIGLTASDIDLATIHPPEGTMERLQRAGIRAVPTGLAHGTVTAVIASGPVEVTTLRRDVATDGRHAVVAYSADWREDAARRDFTINALYADTASGEVHDFHGGLADLAARRVRFIGDPLQRIAEDHLRILRFFRFHARFGDPIDADGLDACTVRANDLMALSRERVAAELLKLLVAPGAVAVIALMAERGIFRAVLPEIDGAGAGRLARLAADEERFGVAAEAIRRLAALLPPEAADAVGARLKLSNGQRRRLIAATAGTGTEGAQALSYRAGPESAADRLLIAGLDPTPILSWTPPRLPIGGGDLVARGLSKGPTVAATLKAIEARWIAEGFPGRERVEAIADAAVGATSGGSTPTA